MPRNYVARRKFRTYSEDILNEAITKIRDHEMSLKAVSKKYAIPIGTLHNRVNNKHTKSVCRPRALSEAEERELVKLINICGDWRYPMSAFDVRMFISHYMKETSKFYVRDISFSRLEICTNSWILIPTGTST